jgi:hypothetical protein
MLVLLIFFTGLPAIHFAGTAVLGKNNKPAFGVHLPAGLRRQNAMPYRSAC